MMTPAGTCNGAGTCVPGTSISCNGYACSTTGPTCRTQCTQDEDCAHGYFCTAPTCTAQFPPGHGCFADDECQDGAFCNGGNHQCTTKFPPGSGCFLPDECQSGMCNNNTCL
jgi:hypothetical protein